MYRLEKWSNRTPRSARLMDQLLLREDPRTSARTPFGAIVSPFPSISCARLRTLNGSFSSSLLKLASSKSTLSKRVLGAEAWECCMKWLSRKGSSATTRVMFADLRLDGCVRIGSRASIQTR